MFFRYIKKEDAKFLARNQKISSYIIMGAMAIVPTIMQFLIIPRLIEIAADMNYSLPVYSRYYFPIAMVLWVLLSLSIYGSGDLEDELKEKLQKYKKGEMILISRLLNKQYQLKVMGMMFVMIFYMVFSIILPIYKITEMVY